MSLTKETRTELSAVEEELRRIGYRGHVYSARGCPVVLTATAMNPNPRVPPVVSGPEPLERAMLSAIGTRKPPENWLMDGADAARHGTPPPVIWNTRELVVTGVTATHALIMALHRPADYAAGQLEALTAKAAPKSRAGMRKAFENATAKKLPQDAERWLHYLPEDSEQADAPEQQPKGVDEPETRKPTTLQAIAADIRIGVGHTSIERLLMRGVARNTLRMTPADRRHELNVEPPLTETQWDPFLATIAEHVAWLHDEKTPTWVNGPTRFADPPVNHMIFRHSDGFCSGPAAFIRHGTLADPRDLDPRGGEYVDWTRRQQEVGKTGTLETPRRTQRPTG